jgi:hypothetical protein
VGDPLVSLVLVVKDGMPFVAEALASVAAQAYRPLELVVQDGGSTDGTLAALEACRGLPEVRLESGADAGPADAWARALRRCRGEIVGSVDADNRLEPGAVAAAVAAFDAHPGTAAVYGRNRMIDAAGEPMFVFDPAPFEVLRVLACELVPPWAASFFSRAVCGPELRFDPGFPTSAELDLWLRIAHLPVRRIDAVLADTRVSPRSATCRPDSYEAFCRDKIAIAERWLRRVGDPAVAAALRTRAVAGVYAWAAASLHYLEGPDGRWTTFAARAEAADPCEPRVAALRRTDAERRAEAARRAGAERDAALEAEREAAREQAAAAAERAVLAARLARMAARPGMLDDAELAAAADALADVLNARDVLGHVLARRGRFPRATLPLLVVHLARAWAGADAERAAGLEALFGLLAAEGGGAGSAAAREARVMG